MATPYYVAKTGNDGWDGLSWGTAKLTIQAGVNLASSTDTVWVRAGTYVENIIVGVGITVRSETGLPTEVIVDGNTDFATTPRVITMGTSSKLIGCTVRNGGGSQDGGGIYGGSVFNCIVSGNWAIYMFHGGGAAYCTLYNSLLIGNNASYGGGVAYCILYNCTISGNDVTTGIGGGAYGCTLINSISWGNNGYTDDFSEGGSESYSCGLNYTGLNSIDIDPLFVDSGGGNYRLSSSSPCIDAGFNYSWMTDPADARSKDLDGNPRIWNSVVDMGTYESEWFESSSQSSLSSTSSSSLSSISSPSSVSSQSSLSSSSSSVSSQSSLSSSSSSSFSSLSSLSSMSSSSSLSSSSSISSPSSSSISSLSSLSSSSLSSSSESSSSISSQSSGIPMLNPYYFVYNKYCNNVLLTDNKKHIVYEISWNDVDKGDIIWQHGNFGTGVNNLNYPTVAIYDSENSAVVWIADSGNKRIKKIDRSGFTDVVSIYDYFVKDNINVGFNTISRMFSNKDNLILVEQTPEQEFFNENINLHPALVRAMDLKQDGVLTKNNLKDYGNLLFTPVMGIEGG